MFLENDIMRLCQKANQYNIRLNSESDYIYKQKLCQQKTQINILSSCFKTQERMFLHWKKTRVASSEKRERKIKVSSAASLYHTVHRHLQLFSSVRIRKSN